MLGRVAEGIFWLYRYLERAENTARLLAAGHRMALTRRTDEATQEWRSVLITLELDEDYDKVHQGYSGAQVCDFVLRARTNPNSVLSMFERARTNARTCRSAITREVWEAINEGWMNLRELLSRPVREANLGPVLAAIRRESSLARGATHGSMLRNEIYAFARLGTFLERADNTARILDVKYYLLLPSLSYVGTALDSGQWENVLRSLSGERAFSWLNAGRIDARSITEFLLLDERFPRSLRFCQGAMHENLDALARHHGGKGLAHESLARIDAMLDDRTVEQVFEHGLHEFIRGFITANAAIADGIARNYHFQP